MVDSPWVINVTSQNFEEAVLRQSTQVPVIVDFWAPSCQPCVGFGPTLEKVVIECGGRVILAKINCEECQDLAQMMGIQSIPLIVAFVAGRPVDDFAGVLPEDQLRQWVARFLPSKAEELLTEALQLEATDQILAEAKLRESLELDEQDATKIHLARLLLAQSKDTESLAIITALEIRGYLEPEAENIKAQIELRAAAEESGGIVEARKAADADPANLALQVTLGEALAADGRHREAFEVLVAVVEKDIAGPQGKAAKEQMVKLFGILGTGNALTSEFRRRLAMLLF